MPARIHVPPGFLGADEDLWMRTLDATARSMPDIANEARSHTAAKLDWVGMQEVCVPVTIPGAHGKLIETPARVQVFVNLIRGDARGIHMSRLYLALDRRLGEDSLSPRSVHALLQDFLSSHVDLSDRAMVRIGFDLLLKRPALVSDKAGWKPYPVVLTGILDKPHFTLELATEILYSSTCPASAALARQLIQEQFRSDFPVTQALDREAVVAWLGSERGIVATPHSQRSRLAVRTRLQPGFQELPIVELIDRIEGALKTPVQTAVKREDEQAFARLNGANLMFCEDAARRVHTALQADPHILDFWARATHEESLHAHDAVAVTTKGVAGGYTGASEWVAS